ncbi:selection and upkeep of intraepithelial T-cells protein 1-like [Channa argus]|uniref:selection and upkeep of intraepithelial T-cells protein 1-like n=1 Tax=Channa argus TaxID=215402 RepID=UPI0029477C53|nr:hypothetical protein Q8A73_012707 [Channa argus]
MSDWVTGLLVIVTAAVFCPAVGQFKVIGSSQPIVATLNDDVILPCSVDPLVNVEDMMVDWWRPDLPPDPRDSLSQYKYVHCYPDNRNVEDMKMSSFAGRTALFKDELKHGNVSLKIMNVKLSDQGRYRCALPQLGVTTVIKLIVEPKPVKTRTTEAPPLIIITTSNSKKAETKGYQFTLDGLVLPMVIWIITFLCFGPFGYLLVLYQNYLPTYTPKGQTTFLPPLKPV